MLLSKVIPAGYGTALVRQELVSRPVLLHHSLASAEIMTIRYTDGKAIEGVTLARTANTMRVAVKGCEDAAEFINVHGTWISEDCEPVTMEYGPRRDAPTTLSEADCICPRELAARLIDLLLTDSAEDEWDGQTTPQRPQDVFLSARMV
jgi:hypothetical protein